MGRGILRQWELGEGSPWEEEEEREGGRRLCYLLPLPPYLSSPFGFPLRPPQPHEKSFGKVGSMPELEVLLGRGHEQARGTPPERGPGYCLWREACLFSLLPNLISHRGDGKRGMYLRATSERESRETRARAGVGREVLLCVFCGGVEKGVEEAK